MMRTATQPGPIQSPRILAEVTRQGRDIIISLPEGSDLLDGLRDAVLSAGGTAAGITLLGGDMTALHYFTGIPDETGQRIATYGAPTPLQAPITLLSGNAIVGLDEAGNPMVHCHAVMVDASGKVHGGHLPPGECRVGPGGVRAMVTLHDGITFAVADDPETNYSIFHPVALGSETLS